MQVLGGIGNVCVLWSASLHVHVHAVWCMPKQCMRMSMCGRGPTLSLAVSDH